MHLNQAVYSKSENSIQECLNRGELADNDTISMAISNDFSDQSVIALLKSRKRSNNPLLKTFVDPDLSAMINYAIYKGRSVEVVNAILSEGGQVSNNPENNVLDSAIRRRASEDVVESLLKAGAQVVHDDNHPRNSTLYYAIEKGYSNDVIKSLFNAGAQVENNASDSRDNTLY
jgi:ankyrin repeat protein